MALLLQLFWTHPQKGKEQFNTIDIDNFAQSIDELQHADNFDLINFTISPTNPALEQIKQQYGPSPEDDLMENLDTITDTEKVETIIP